MLEFVEFLVVHFLDVESYRYSIEQIFIQSLVIVLQIYVEGLFVAYVVVIFDFIVSLYF